MPVIVVVTPGLHATVTTPASSLPPELSDDDPGLPDDDPELPDDDPELPDDDPEPPEDDPELPDDDPDPPEDDPAHPRHGPKPVPLALHAWAPFAPPPGHAQDTCWPGMHTLAPGVLPEVLASGAPRSGAFGLPPHAETSAPPVKQRKKAA